MPRVYKRSRISPVFLSPPQSRMLLVALTLGLATAAAGLSDTLRINKPKVPFALVTPNPPTLQPYNHGQPRHANALLLFCSLLAIRRSLCGGDRSTPAAGSEIGPRRAGTARSRRSTPHSPTYRMARSTDGCTDGPPPRASGTRILPVSILSIDHPLPIRIACLSIHVGSGGGGVVSVGVPPKTHRPDLLPQRCAGCTCPRAR